MTLYIGLEKVKVINKLDYIFLSKFNLISLIQI